MFVCLPFCREGGDVMIVFSGYTVKEKVCQTGWKICLILRLEIFFRLWFHRSPVLITFKVISVVQNIQYRHTAAGDRPPHNINFKSKHSNFNCPKRTANAETAFTLISRKNSIKIIFFPKFLTTSVCSDFNIALWLSVPTTISHYHGK